MNSLTKVETNYENSIVDVEQEDAMEVGTSTSILIETKIQMKRRRTTERPC